MSKRMFFIVNAAAGGRTLERWRGFESALKRVGISFDQARCAETGQAFSFARQRAGACDVIAAVGGDGTIFEVVSGILAGGSQRAALAIVPFGTGNDSARTVGIQSEADALQALTAGAPRAIDAIEIQCQAGGATRIRHAMLFASVGITADLLKHTTPRLKRFWGWRLAYLAGLVIALRSYVPGPMRITRDGQTIQGRFIFAGASNGETFGGGIRIAPGARPDDGKLNVNLIEAVGRGEALRHLLRLRRGHHTNHPKVSYTTALSLAIETDPPIEVAADGDLIGHTPVRFQVRPQALRVLTPGVTSPR